MIIEGDDRSMATFSDDRTRRFSLFREILPAHHGVSRRIHIAWIMLNPSKAGARNNDPTINRVIPFTQALAYFVNGQEATAPRGLAVSVGNLTSLISTDPKGIADDAGTIEEDLARLADVIVSAHCVVLAWGANAWRVPERKRRVVDMLALFQKAPKPLPLVALGKTEDGEPKHPLRLSSASPFLLLTAHTGGKGMFPHLHFGGLIASPASVNHTAGVTVRGAT